jgi:hypothetical protein
MTRFTIVLTILAATYSIAEAQSADSSPEDKSSDVLYNGIALSKPWPPKDVSAARTAPAVPPYLKSPPAIIPIDVGRQLFVDDFLIEKTDLARKFHYPTKYEHNPVLKPETLMELNGGRRPCATVFQDGVWFDPTDRLFKMWYHAGWYDGTGYATSKDGLTWQRPMLDVLPGTNRVLPREHHGRRDGSAVWIDPFATDPAARFKMFMYERPTKDFGGQVFTSPDGIHWSTATRTPYVGDNTDILYNPFRKKWVYSIRIGVGGRSRGYRECDDLIQGASWKPSDVVLWARADSLDLPDPGVAAMMPSTDVIRKEAEKKGKTFEQLLANYKDKDYGTQLYNVDAIAYESLMLGVFAIHRGPPNEVCEKLKIPKITDLELAYSRDGFHWDRPDRTAFLPGTRREGDWDRNYLHAAATICAIVGDKLYFYYGGWSGQSPELGGDMYAGGATGVAFLRRDGFASMEAGASPGALLTRPLRFRGQHLFINADASHGAVRAEILDENSNALKNFTVADSIAFQGDSTKTQLSWKTAPDLSALQGKVIRIRFVATNASIYAFWISPDAHGASHGYVAAGGPEFTGPIDDGAAH